MKPTTLESPLPKPPERRGMFVLYAALAVGLVSAGYVFRAELGQALLRLEVLIGMLGPAAPFGMAIICGLWGALCLPGPLMQGTVATLFSSQPPVAFGVVMAGETLAMSIAFVVGRFLGRERVRRTLEGKPWFARLEAETARRGFYGVFLFRLMPFFPNALASYAFGLTSLRYPIYLVASVLGSFPKMVLYIYGTTSAITLVRAGTVSTASLLAAVVVIVVLALIGRRLQLSLRRRQAS